LGSLQVDSTYDRCFFALSGLRIKTFKGKEQKAMSETIGNRISKYRKEKGMTQEELANKMGVSSQAVSKWENDASCPDIGLVP